MSFVPTQPGPPLSGAAGRAAPGSVPARGDRPSGGSAATRPGAAPSWRERAQALTAPVVTGVLVAGATLVVALVDPHRPGSYGVCPLYALTGVYCVGCGGLRATYDLAHGDLAGAWSMNPLWVLLVPVLVAVWARWLVRRWTSSSSGAVRGAARVGGPVTGAVRTPWLVLVVLVAYSAARNVPALAPWVAP